MLITASNLDALFIAFSKNFEDAYMTEAAPLTDMIGSRIPSNTRDQRYPFVQAISGAMREWVGPRQINNVVVDGFTITNKKWENSLSILRTDIEDDQYNVYSNMLIPNLARHARLNSDVQIAATIEANATGYDGKAFFASDHPYDPSGATPGSQSNLLTTNPLNSSNLAKSQAAMMTFKGPDALPMGSYGDTLLVPPSLKYTADTLANATFFPEAKNGTSNAVFGAQSNVFQGQYKVVVSPYLTDTGSADTAVWYLLDCRSPKMRPFFWQEREPAQLISMIDPASPTVFFEDIYYMGARARGAAAAALWFKAIKSTT